MRRRWVFFMSLKVGAEFQTRSGVLYCKVSESEARHVVSGALEPFRENRVCWLVKA